MPFPTLFLPADERRPGRLPRALAFTALLALCAAPSHAQTPPIPATTGTGTGAASRSGGGGLPSLGDSEMALGAERRLGDRIVREIYRDPDYIDDPVVQEYVEQIWRSLLVAARARGEITSELDQRFAFEILMGKDRTINAFALPGGYLGLHLGLIGVVASADELASVLAHELSHVTQRHISRLTAKQSEQTPWLLGALILGAMAASKSPDAATALIAGGQAVAIQNQLNFSRDMEREADRIGFGIMTQAGFAPQAFVSMFDKLQQSARLNDSGAFPYLRSHPLTSERMGDMQARQQLGSTPPLEPTLEHAMVSARARVLSNGGVDALRMFVSDATSLQSRGVGGTRAVGSLYAGVLAAIRLRDYIVARDLLDRLQAQVKDGAPAMRLANLLHAELALQSGSKAPELGLQGRPELLLGAPILIAQGRAGEVAQSLLAWVTAHPRDAAAWQWLAAASTAQGQPLRAIRADAEARVAHLDFAGALERFKAAQTLLRSTKGSIDHIEASIIDTRSRAVQSLLREQSLER